MTESRKRNYLRAYEAAEEVWSSEVSTSEQKAMAWRVQRSLLLATAGNEPGRQFAVLKRHYNKLEQKLEMSQMQKFSTFDCAADSEGSCEKNAVVSPAAKRKPPSDIKVISVQSKQEQMAPIFTMKPVPLAVAGKYSTYDEAARARSKQQAENVPSDTNTKEDNVKNAASNEFLTARQVLTVKMVKNAATGGTANSFARHVPEEQPMRTSTNVRLGGLTRYPTNTRLRPANAEFVSPLQKETTNLRTSTQSTPSSSISSPVNEMSGIDPAMIEVITNQIMRKDTNVSWTDIAGLENAKTFIREAAVLPLLRPDIFTGLRRPPRGILLFGPPGTGKTLIGKCIASQSGATFFSISASTLTSKWIGDGEKMVRALFAVAALHKPSVIFIDEIDSLLSKRSESEHESSRRLKTEFLLQFDGTNTSHEDRILVVGATNRPQELDEAARRRFVRRLYIPLPDDDARQQVMSKLLESIPHSLDKVHMKEIVNLTAGYSGADIHSLCHEAAMQPIRTIPLTQMLTLPAEEVRPINIDDFHSALNSVRSSVAQTDLTQYLEWNHQYGSL